MNPLAPQPLLDQEGQQRQLLQLIDEEEWFNLYGLRPAGHEEVNANDREIASRVVSESSYQKEIHAKIFAEDDNGEKDPRDGSSRHRTSQNQKRAEQLKQWKEETIDILTTNPRTLYHSTSETDPDCSCEKIAEEKEEKSSPSVTTDDIVVIRTNLMELAARSDTVFAMASNQHLFHISSSCDNNCDGNGSLEDAIPFDAGSSATDTSRAEKDTSTTDQRRISLSLRDYSTESVKIFLNVLLSSPLSLPHKNYTSPSDPLATTSTTNRDTDTEEATSSIIPPEFVIDCCRLAHYLQCQQLLDSIVDDYLMAPDSIDHENCRFLCKLADELSLPRLWEVSVNHMLSSLDNFEDTNDESSKGKDSNAKGDKKNNENEGCLWEDLSPALKTEIQALRGILRSSNRKNVYFSTYHEYLGLLAEHHQYYRERLEDAQHGLKVRLEEESRLREKLQALEAEKASNGWYGNAHLQKQIETANRMLYGLVRGREYAASKIEKQQKRVETLKALWKEQKKVFGGGVDSNDGCLRFERKR